MSAVVFHNHPNFMIGSSFPLVVSGSSCLSFRFCPECALLEELNRTECETKLESTNGPMQNGNFNIFSSPPFSFKVKIVCSY